MCNLQQAQAYLTGIKLQIQSAVCITAEAQLVHWCTIFIGQGKNLEISLKMAYSFLKATK